MQGQNAPFTAALMSLARGDGWDAFDAAAMSEAEKQESAAETAARLADARLVADALTTPAGQRFMTQWLLARTLLKDDADERVARTTEELALAAARRSGRNELVREMLRAISFAASGGNDEG